MTRLQKKARLLAAVAAGLSASSIAFATASQPLVDLSFEASNTQNGTYSSSPLTVTPGETVYFEVVGQMAPVGTSNTQGATTRTITSLTQGAAGAAGFDGINAVSFTYVDPAANAIQVSFSTPTLNTNGLSGGGDSWDGTTALASTGTPTTVGSGTSNNELLAAVGAQAGGVHVAATAPSVILMGNFTVAANAPAGSTSTIGGSFGGTNGGFEIDGNVTTGIASVTNKPAITSTTEGGSSPLVLYGNLTLNTQAATAPALTWDGTANGNWNKSSLNWTNGTAAYGDGSAVTFGDKAANGSTAVQNTNPISIVAGGVAPASVAFTNSSTTYRLTDSDSANGITGNASVAINGGGMVIFSSSNSYSGGTSIASGTLKAAAGSLLSTGNVTVGATGKLVLGDGIASGLTTLAIGNESLAAGASLVAKVDGASSASDQLNIGSGNGVGTLTLPGSGNVTISLAGDGVALGSTAETWQIATFGAISNFTGGTITTQGVAAGSQFALNTSSLSVPDGGSIALTLNSLGGGRDALEAEYSGTTVAAPEPTTAVLALTGVVPMIAARRRRARDKSAKQA